MNVGYIQQEKKLPLGSVAIQLQLGKHPFLLEEHPNLPLVFVISIKLIISG